MASMTNYLADAILNETLRNTNYVPPVTVYLSLHTADPTRTGSHTAEVAVGGYARKAITFAAPADSGTDEQVKNSALVDFGTATADWGIVTHWGIEDAATLGNMLYRGALTSSKTVQNGDPVSAAINAIAVDLL